MEDAAFGKFLKGFQDEMALILEAKGADYAGSTDRLANFRRLGMNLGLRPEVIWVVYAQKHMDAIMTWARTGRVSSEEIRGRFLDLANYCALGAAMASEGKE